MELLLESPVQPGELPPQADTLAGTALAGVLDELAHGVVVTTLEGCVLHASRVARFELATRRALMLQDQMVQPRLAREAVLLRDALQGAGAGKRSLVRFSAREGIDLAVAVVPLAGAEAAVPGRAALMFARAAVCDTLVLSLFARSHGLTVTEESVLAILCQGYSAPDVAVQMGIAVSTVRSHVRSLCDKTRAQGVRELVSRIAVLPPVSALTPISRQESMH